jgi:Zn-finger nucleic acid-binding protein
MYRDRPITCPRCGVDLERAGERDHWACKRCHGELLATAVVVEELVKIAPELAAAGGVEGLTTLARRTKAAPLSCGVCGTTMEPVFLGAVEVDRCYHDEMIWFDLAELPAVLERAEAQAHPRRRTWRDVLVGRDPT